MTELEREVYEAIRDVRMAERKELRRIRRNYWIGLILIWAGFFALQYWMIRFVIYLYS